MTRFFFDLHNDTDVVDEEGREFADQDAAKVYALAREAREMIQVDVEEHGIIDLRHRLEVRDKSGAVAFTMLFDDAVVVCRDSEVL